MQENPAARVIAKFGPTLRKASERLNYPYKRLWNWRNVGRIPQHWQRPLLDEARRLGVKLKPIDFVAHLEEPAGAPDSLRKAG
jgi:hypothetical protein